MNAPLFFREGNHKSTLCVPYWKWYHQRGHSLKALSGPNHSSRSSELLIPQRVRPFKGSINRSMAKLNKDTKNIAHLSATLDIFSRCLSNCNCQKVIWNHSREQLAHISQPWIHKILLFCKYIWYYLYHFVLKYNIILSYSCKIKTTTTIWGLALISSG